MIFVGLEIRQNTEAVRGSTIQAISDQSLQFNLALERWAPDFIEFMEREVLAPSPP